MDQTNGTDEAETETETEEVWPSYLKWPRSSKERHREQCRAANRARYRAVQQLIAENLEEFNEIYAGEALTEGVVAQPRLEDSAVLVRQLARLQARLDRIRQREGEGDG